MTEQSDIRITTKDIPAEVFKSLLPIYQEEYAERKSDFFSSSLMHALQYRLNKERELVSRGYSKEALEKIQNFVLEKFPNLSGKSPAEQADIFGRWRHDAGNGSINNYFIYDLKTHRSEEYPLSPENIDLGIDLANFLAKKTTEIGDEKSVQSFIEVIRNFMNYNWDRLKEMGFDAPLAIPEEFHNEKFLDLLYLYFPDIANDFADFCRAKTARDWLKNLGPKALTPLPMATWKEIFERYPWPEIQKNLLPCDSDESVQRTKEFQDLVKKKAKRKVDGIFVDIDGTLLDGYDFDKSLYEDLCELAKCEKVTIFTGGDIERQKARLAQNGVDLKKFQVVSKDDYRGCLFTGVIIDDTLPEMQGFILQDEDVYCPAGMFFYINAANRMKKFKFLPKFMKKMVFKKVWKEEMAIIHSLQRSAPAYQYSRKIGSMQMEYRQTKGKYKRSRAALAIKLRQIRVRYRSLPKPIRMLLGKKNSEIARGRALIKEYYDAHPEIMESKKFVTEFFKELGNRR